jgi:hypothetical protein
MDRSIESAQTETNSPSSGMRCRVSPRITSKLVFQADLGMDGSTHDGTFRFFTSLSLEKGYQRPLLKEDLWRYDEDRLTRLLADKLTVNLEKRIQRGVTKYTLLAALNETFFRTFWTSGFLKVIFRSS